MTTRAATLADVAVPAIGDGQAARWVRAAILVAGGAALTALSAQIVWYAPWNPLVPYTFQTSVARAAADCVAVVTVCSPCSVSPVMRGHARGV